MEHTHKNANHTEAETWVRIAGEQLERIRQEDGSDVKMPERVFRFVFLPFFATGKMDRRYGKGMETWVSVAGGWFKPVDVYNAQGEILFTVPPIYNRNAIRTVPNSRRGIGTIIENANLYANVNPREGQRYLEDELSRRAMTNDLSPFLHENLEVWNAIFTRYRYPKIAEAAPTPDAVSKVTTPQDTNYEQWDDA